MTSILCAAPAYCPAEIESTGNAATMPDLTMAFTACHFPSRTIDHGIEPKGLPNALALIRARPP